MSRKQTAMLTKLLEERGRLEKQIEALQSELKGLDRAIAVLQGEDATAKAVPQQRERAKNVKDTVMSLVTEAGVKGITVLEVLEAAKKRNVHLERGTVSSLLSRFKREGAFEMVDGRYFVPPRPAQAGSESSIWN